ncbi:hypothetical protein TNCV_683331 [Trichonephila clavipes]|nr:hypothetical protein TNCV_683331 [Trichonephila clavipes]
MCPDPEDPHQDTSLHYARPVLKHGRDKADGLISYRSASEGDVARFDFPGSVQNVYIRSESRKDSPRGTIGSRTPSGVPRATLFSYKR